MLEQIVSERLRLTAVKHARIGELHSGKRGSPGEVEALLADVLHDLDLLMEVIYGKHWFEQQEGVEEREDSDKPKHDNPAFDQLRKRLRRQRGAWTERAVKHGRQFILHDESILVAYTTGKLVAQGKPGAAHKLVKELRAT